MADKIFSEGIYLNKVHDRAPEFVKANVSIHVKKAIEWLQTLEHKGVIDEKGYIRLSGKEGREGKRYFEVDTWKPEKKEEAVDYNNPPY